MLLDYKITLGRAVFEIFPDFLGYFLLMKGMESLSGESRCFDRGRHWAFAMTLASALLALADLTDLDTMTRVLLWGLELAALVITLAMVKTVITGLGQMGRAGTEMLKSIWLILAVLLPLCHLLRWIPMVGDICMWASMIASAVFLAAFFKIK